MLERRIITFNEADHTYRDEYNDNYISATTLIGTVQKPYDTEFWSVYRQVDRAGVYSPRPYPEEREIQVTHNGVKRRYSIGLIKSGILPGVQSNHSVKKEWKESTEESCTWGTDKHNYLEYCINRFYSDHVSDSRSEFNKLTEVTGRLSENQSYRFKVVSVEELNNSPLKDTYPKVYNILVSLINKGYTLYAEVRVYHPDYLVAGTIDVLAIRGKEFVIVDWKTNKKPLKFIPGYYKKVWDPTRTYKYETDEWVDKEERLLYPLNDLMNSKGMIYTLQLSLYAYIMECWGYTVKALILCHIRPKLDEEKRIVYDANGDRIELPAEIYMIDYKKGAIQRLFEFRLKQLKVN